MTQQEIAQAVGVHQTTIGRWLDGDREPSVTELTAICRFFEVTADWLLGLSDHPKAIQPNSWLIDEADIRAIRAAQTGPLNGPLDSTRNHGSFDSP